MKIKQIIKEKRKQLGLTQENIAEYLGVSTPAVSKWENGTTYPDITLLPGLARLLKTDLNTLLSFNEEMSEIEINNVVMTVQSTIQEEGFEKIAALRTSWANAEVKGYVKVVVSASGAANTTVKYYVALADTSHHGVKDSTTEADRLTRGSVETSGVSITAPTSNVCVEN